MSNLTPADRERLKAEIQTAIAAGREVDGTMDQHLADSVLDRYSQDSAVLSRNTPTAAVVAQPHENHTGELIVRAITTLGVLGVAALIITQNPYMWWVIFPLFGIFGGAWRRSGYRGRHYAYQSAAQPKPQPHVDDDDEDFKRQYRDAKRRLKLQALENEINRLKTNQDS